MARIALIDADGVCTNAILADLGTVEGGIDVTALPVAPGWTYDGTTWTPPGLPPFDRSVMVTPAQLMLRFTLDERQAIRAAAATRPIVADWIELVKMQPLWRLDDEYIEWGLTGAVQAGLLTAARAKEILGIED
jgi:hypothetical protein